MSSKKHNPKPKQTGKNIVDLSVVRHVQGQVMKPPRVGPLNTQKGTRSQIAKIYRRTVRGEIDPADGSKLVYMLHTLSKVIETESLEDRIKRLEEREEYEER